MAALTATFATKPADQWVDALLAAGVPVGKIRGVREALDSAATFSIGSLEQVRPGFGITSSVLPPPLLGEHSREILAELGWSTTRIDELVTEGVIRAAERTVR